MGDTAQKWLMGCGIGCAIVILIGVALFGSCYYCARHVTRGFDQGTKVEQDLVTRYGRIRDYVPPLDGVVAPERMRAFLAVRDSIAPLRGGLEQAFASFEQAERMRGHKDLKTIFGVVRGAVSMAPLAGDYLRRRNTALLFQEMGLGEYSYIYCLGYFSFLGLKPGETLRRLRSDDEEEEGGAALRAHMHRRMLEILKNLQSALDREAGPGVAAKGGGRSAPRAGSFREAVDEEIAKMLADDARLPWQDGLPPGLAAGFAAFRERLQATYIPAGDLFEFGSSYRSRGGGIRFGTTEADSSI